MVCKTYKCEYLRQEIGFASDTTLVCMCFSPGYPSESHPCVALYVLPGEVGLSMSFPISDAKIQQYIDICKLFVHY